MKIYFFIFYDYLYFINIFNILNGDWGCGMGNWYLHLLI